MKPCRKYIFTALFIAFVAHGSTAEAGIVSFLRGSTSGRSSDQDSVREIERENLNRKKKQVSFKNIKTEDMKFVSERYQRQLDKEYVAKQDLKQSVYEAKNRQKNYRSERVNRSNVLRYVSHSVNDILYSKLDNTSKEEVKFFQGMRSKEAPEVFDNNILQKFLINTPSERRYDNGRSVDEVKEKERFEQEIDSQIYILDKDGKYVLNAYHESVQSPVSDNVIETRYMRDYKGSKNLGLRLDESGNYLSKSFAKSQDLFKITLFTRSDFMSGGVINQCIARSNNESLRDIFGNFFQPRAKFYFGQNEHMIFFDISTNEKRHGIDDMEKNYGPYEINSKNGFSYSSWVNNGIAMQVPNGYYGKDCKMILSDEVYANVCARIESDIEYNLENFVIYQFKDNDHHDLINCQSAFDAGNLIMIDKIARPPLLIKKSYSKSQLQDVIEMSYDHFNEIVNVKINPMKVENELYNYNIPTANFSIPIKKPDLSNLNEELKSCVLVYGHKVCLETERCSMFFQNQEVLDKLDSCKERVAKIVAERESLGSMSGSFEAVVYDKIKSFSNNDEYSDEYLENLQSESEIDDPDRVCIGLVKEWILCQKRTRCDFNAELRDINNCPVNKTPYDVTVGPYSLPYAPQWSNEACLNLNFSDNNVYKKDGELNGMIDMKNYNFLYYNNLVAPIYKSVKFNKDTNLWENNILSMPDDCSVISFSNSRFYTRNCRESFSKDIYSIIQKKNDINLPKNLDVKTIYSRLELGKRKVSDIGICVSISDTFNEKKEYKSAIIDSDILTENTKVFDSYIPARCSFVDLSAQGSGSGLSFMFNGLSDQAIIASGESGSSASSVIDVNQIGRKNSISTGPIDFIRFYIGSKQSKSQDFNILDLRNNCKAWNSSGIITDTEYSAAYPSESYGSDVIVGTLSNAINTKKIIEQNDLKEGVKYQSVFHKIKKFELDEYLSKKAAEGSGNNDYAPDSFVLDQEGFFVKYRELNIIAFAGKGRSCYHKNSFFHEILPYNYDVLKSGYSNYSSIFNSNFQVLKELAFPKWILDGLKSGSISNENVNNFCRCPVDQDIEECGKRNANAFSNINFAAESIYQTFWDNATCGLTAGEVKKDSTAICNNKSGFIYDSYNYGYKIKEQDRSFRQEYKLEIPKTSAQYSNRSCIFSSQEIDGDILNSYVSSRGASAKGKDNIKSYGAGSVFDGKTRLSSHITDISNEQIYGTKPFVSLTPGLASRKSGYTSTNDRLHLQFKNDRLISKELSENKCVSVCPRIAIDVTINKQKYTCEYGSYVFDKNGIQINSSENRYESPLGSYSYPSYCTNQDDGSVLVPVREVAMSDCGQRKMIRDNGRFSDFCYTVGSDKNIANINNRIVIKDPKHRSYHLDYMKSILSSSAIPVSGIVEVGSGANNGQAIAVGRDSIQVSTDLLADNMKLTCGDYGLWSKSDGYYSTKFSTNDEFGLISVSSAVGIWLNTLKDGIMDLLNRDMLKAMSDDVMIEYEDEENGKVGNVKNQKAKIYENESFTISIDDESEASKAALRFQCPAIKGVAALKMYSLDYRGNAELEATNGGSIAEGQCLDGYMSLIKFKKMCGANGVWRHGSWFDRDICYVGCESKLDVFRNIYWKAPKVFNGISKAVCVRDDSSEDAGYVYEHEGKDWLYYASCLGTDKLILNGDDDNFHTLKSAYFNSSIVSQKCVKKSEGQSKMYSFNQYHSNGISVYYRDEDNKYSVFKAPIISFSCKINKKYRISNIIDKQAVSEADDETKEDLKKLVEKFNENIENKKRGDGDYYKTLKTNELSDQDINQSVFNGDHYDFSYEDDFECDMLSVETFVGKDVYTKITRNFGPSALSDLMTLGGHYRLAYEEIRHKIRNNFYSKAGFCYVGEQDVAYKPIMRSMALNNHCSIICKDNYEQYQFFDCNNDFDRVCDLSQPYEVLCNKDERYFYENNTVDDLKVIQSFEDEIDANGGEIIGLYGNTEACYNKGFAKAFFENFGSGNMNGVSKDVNISDYCEQLSFNHTIEVPEDEFVVVFDKDYNHEFDDNSFTGMLLEKQLEDKESCDIVFNDKKHSIGHGDRISIFDADNIRSNNLRELTPTVQEFYENDIRFLRLNNIRFTEIICMNGNLYKINESSNPIYDYIVAPENVSDKSSYSFYKIIEKWLESYFYDISYIGKNPMKKKFYDYIIMNARSKSSISNIAVFNNSNLIVNYNDLPILYRKDDILYANSLENNNNTARFQ